MSLNEEDRNTVVRLQMEKAYLFLEQANEMYKQHYWDIASNVIIMPVIMLFKHC